MDNCKLQFDIGKIFCKGDIHKSATITGYSGDESLIVIPDILEIDGEIIPIEAVGKKAFFGNARIKEIVLPRSVKAVDSWAFSQCGRLKRVECESDDIAFGKGVFLQSEQLESVCIGQAKENSFAHLYAWLSRDSRTEELLPALSHNIEVWLQILDERMIDYIRKDDQEGIGNHLLGGEEDISKNASRYISERKRFKAMLCFIRLINSECLSKDNRDIYDAYIREHSAGAKSQEAWRLVLDNYIDCIEYYEVLVGAKAVTGDNISQMLDDLGDEHIEVKSFLISNSIKTETFDDLTL